MNTSGWLVFYGWTCLHLNVLLLNININQCAVDEHQQLSVNYWGAQESVIALWINTMFYYCVVDEHFSVYKCKWINTRIIQCAVDTHPVINRSALDKHHCWIVFCVWTPKLISVLCVNTLGSCRPLRLQYRRPRMLRRWRLPWLEIGNVGRLPWYINTWTVHLTR